MDKRKNYHDNFEEVYLREPTVRKYLPLADQSILLEPDFKKVVRYLSDLFYKKHQNLLLRHGFESDDIQSVATLWCLVFTGIKPLKDFAAERPESPIADAKHDYYNVMMNFTGQRLSRLCDWIIKKFGVDDVANDKVQPNNEIFTTSADSQMDAIIYHHGMASVNTVEDEIIERLDADILTKSMNDEPLESQLGQFQEALTSIKTRIALVPNEDGNPATSKLHRRAERLKDRIFAIQGKRRAQVSDFKTMKTELLANLEKYKESLAYFATSRQTAADARKKARELCRKCGINYSEWAKKQIKSNGRDASEFVF